MTNITSHRISYPSFHYTDEKLKVERGRMMFDDVDSGWENHVVAPETFLSRIEPGMSIFLGTGVAEPRTIVKKLMASEMNNLTDLELVQIVSLGDAISFKNNAGDHKFRLKTFFAGWLASEAITSGFVDMIPCRFSQIPRLVESGAIRVDVAFVQITPPDRAGYASLGVSVDVAKYAMERASIVVGEINSLVPRTMGNTFVHVDDFDYLVRATEPPIYFPRWPGGGGGGAGGGPPPPRLLECILNAFLYRARF